jgi:modulator of FtsH protease HflC
LLWKSDTINFSTDQDLVLSDESFARYRIRNPLRFYQTVGTIEGANSRLSPLLNSAPRRVLGDFTLTQGLRDDRPGYAGSKTARCKSRKIMK